jgi:hypothetical protein
VESSGHLEEVIAKLERELRAQADLYRALLAQAKRQAEEISADNLDAFVSVLEEKRKIIEELGQREEIIRPLRDYWESHKEEAGEEDRIKLRSAVDEIRALLEELIEVESHSQKKLGGTKQEIEEQFRQLSVGPEAMRSYMERGNERPRFMDEVG